MCGVWLSRYIRHGVCNHWAHGCGTQYVTRQCQPRNGWLNVGWSSAVSSWIILYAGTPFEVSRRVAFFNHSSTQRIFIFLNTRFKSSYPNKWRRCALNPNGRPAEVEPASWNGIWDQLKSARVRGAPIPVLITFRCLRLMRPLGLRSRYLCVHAIMGVA